MLDGIEYAVNQNVDIVNMSLQHFDYSDDIKDTINAASDILFVVYAGNDGADLNTANTTYQRPGMYDCSNMITVAAMNYNGELSPFSNYNGQTRIAAPDEIILNTVPGNDYVFMDGTSMAAPHVSGVAALIWSYYTDLSAAEVRQRIINENNVSYNEKLNGKVSSNGYLNAWYAFSNDSPEPRSIMPSNTDSNNIQTSKERIAFIKIVDQMTVKQQKF